MNLQLPLQSACSCTLLPQQAHTLLLHALYAACMLMVATQSWHACNCNWLMACTLLQHPHGMNAVCNLMHAISCMLTACMLLHVSWHTCCFKSLIDSCKPTQLHSCKHLSSVASVAMATAGPKVTCSEILQVEVHAACIKEVWFKHAHIPRFDRSHDRPKIVILRPLRWNLTT